MREAHRGRNVRRRPHGRACRERGIKLAAGDLDRNIPEYWQARKMIEDGAIGKAVTINILKGVSRRCRAAADNSSAWSGC